MGISEQTIKETFADYILCNRTNKHDIRIVIELAGELDGVRDLPDYYDNGTLIAECKKIMGGKQ